VHPASAIRHGWRLTGAFAPRLRTAASYLGEVAWQIAVFQPTTPRFMGFSLHDRFA
jgi:hypothetical protein